MDAWTHEWMEWGIGNCYVEVTCLATYIHTYLPTYLVTKQGRKKERKNMSSVKDVLMFGFFFFSVFFLDMFVMYVCDVCL